ncbi:hypothetical protein RO3G_09446 [Rhizopus delemar RA 99-880]|uniref:Uncharacterized protein n=1 Tax=Rhizopus delemar (strain RA 99-880 / ATCC MYA-4621 / FGSC 9543 / NRRL 43880) TaxID=246409 RepID=I1C8F6_RHIO9|nr:hypothetical protein RO3G_09446 [Rhizopus delemar RA 99-880]|eukprot:EIE84736.1 hypothetical protein RO3G_09446 [Rhizopus delemar RA 99-880]
MSVSAWADVAPLALNKASSANFLSRACASSDAISSTLILQSFSTVSSPLTTLSRKPGLILLLRLFASMRTFAL